MRSPDGKVIPHRSATSLWLRAERWFVVGDAIQQADKAKRDIQLYAHLGCDPIRDLPITAVGLTIEPKRRESSIAGKGYHSLILFIQHYPTAGWFPRWELNPHAIFVSISDF